MWKNENDLCKRQKMIEILQFWGSCESYTFTFGDVSLSVSQPAFDQLIIINTLNFYNVILFQNFKYSFDSSYNTAQYIHVRQVSKVRLPYILVQSCMGKGCGFIILVLLVPVFQFFLSVFFCLVFFIIYRYQSTQTTYPQSAS